MPISKYKKGHYGRQHSYNQHTYSDTTHAPASSTSSSSSSMTSGGLAGLSFLDSPANSNPGGNVGRMAPLPNGQPPQQQPQVVASNNANGAGMNSIPMNAGQQMDVNLLFQKVCELSEVLKENREKTQSIVNTAEDLATRAATKGALSIQDASAEISSARIADLERQLAVHKSNNSILLDEQKENIKLISEYEHHMGEIVKQVRDYSYNNKMEKTSQARHYNKLLQDEKDAHLAARLEKDDWHSKFMRAVEMLRETYRLRCEEEEAPIRVVAGLQNEVRAYRNALGMEPEKFEEEFGYEILKEVQNGSGEP